MRVQATVIYPVSIELDFEDGTDTEEIRDKVFREADQVIQTTTIKPVIHDSRTHPEIID